MNDQADLIEVAHIVKVRGLRGEVVADLLTDFPDRFEHLESIIGIAPDAALPSLDLQTEFRWAYAPIVQDEHQTQRPG